MVLLGFSKGKKRKGPFILHPNCIVVPNASYHSFSAFQVKMNCTFMRHRNAVTSHGCAARQRNAIAVQYEQTLIQFLYTETCWTSFGCKSLRGYCTPGPYFLRLCEFSQKVKQLWTKYQMDLMRNVPRNSKISFISVETIVVKLL